VDTMQVDSCPMIYGSSLSTEANVDSGWLPSR
jgi:hypothetical protein